MRFGGNGRGKRSGYRAIRCVVNERWPILALPIDGKNEQVDLSPDRKNALARLIERVKTKGLR